MDPVQRPGKGKIYILDDDHVLRDQLKNVLQAAGYDTTCFADKMALVEGVREEVPTCAYLRHTPINSLDLILADLVNYRVPSIVISSQADIPTAVKMIRAGAIDFISGPIEGLEIINRLKTILTEVKEKAHTNEHRLAQYLPNKSVLSLRQREILEHIANGLSSKQIASMLGISWRTVDDHRRQILQRTGTRTTAELIINIMAKGAKKRLSDSDN